MITALINGKLNKDAEVKKSSKGNDYVLMVIRLGDGAFVRCNLFGDDTTGAAGLKRGDEVSVTGRLEVGVWERDGKPQPSLSMMAHRLVGSVL